MEMDWDLSMEATTRARRIHHEELKGVIEPFAELIGEGIKAINESNASGFKAVVQSLENLGKAAGWTQ